MPFLKKYTPYFIALVYCGGFYFFAYALEREDFGKLLLLWSFLFTGYYFLVNNKQISISSLVLFTLVFRLIFLLAIPNLSQDFYRFIWDGRMIFEGFNPYLSLPETFIQQGNYPVQQAQELYAGMGALNGSHYTNYPPINQLCFLIAALFSNKSILGAAVVMRILIILADLGILYFGMKLLKNLNLDRKLIFLYLLNPFIIIELTGNLHFEPVMLFFLLWSLYLLQQKKWILSAVILACSVSVKLIPLLFLPLFFKWFIKGDLKKNLPKLLLYYTIVITTCILLFLPFYSSTLIANYSNSVGLWFRNFEFNASIYYLFREIGYTFRGWNEIAIIGKLMPILTVLFLLTISFFRKNYPTKKLITAMLFALSFYYFTTTTMHPWYLATLLLLAVFTKYRYPMVWSFVIILSYQAYANTPWKENLWFVFLEYLILYSFLFWEIKNPLKKIKWENCYEKEKESGFKTT